MFCWIIGHSFGLTREFLFEWCRTSIVCKRCGKQVLLEEFNPLVNAPEHFKRYWDQSGLGYKERLQDWAYAERARGRAPAFPKDAVQPNHKEA